MDWIRFMAQDPLNLNGIMMDFTPTWVQFLIILTILFKYISCLALHVTKTSNVHVFDKGFFLITFVLLTPNVAWVIFWTGIYVNCLVSLEREMQSFRYLSFLYHIYHICVFDWCFYYIDERWKGLKLISSRCMHWFLLHRSNHLIVRQLCKSARALKPI